MYGYIYKVINLKNLKYYIGKKTGDFDNNYYGSGKIIKQAIEKYGKENFKIEILEICENKKELNESEIQYINKLQPAYNIAKGGDGGDTLSYATELYKQSVYNKRANSLKKKYSGISESKRCEWSKNISKAKKGRSNGREGYTHTKESIEKIKLSNIEAAKKRDLSWYKNHKNAMAKRKGKPAHNKKAIIINGKLYESISEACIMEKTYKQKIYKMIKEGKAYYEKSGNNV